VTSQALQVTLGDHARAAAARHRIPEPHVRRARAVTTSSWETPEWLVVTATLPDGRAIEMRCELARPERVAKLRLV